MTSSSHLPNLVSPDEDPRLWLEAIDGDRALAWVAAENARTRAILGGEALQKDQEALLAALDRPDHIPYVTRRAGLLYNFWTDDKHKRGLWRRTTLDSYCTDNPDWDILLDLDALATKENEDWVWDGASTLYPDHRHAILHLSRGGGDAVTLREFDLETRQFVSDGFNLPEAKSYVEWLDPDTVLLASAHGPATMAAETGYARTIRRWRRGTPSDTAQILFECPIDHVMVYAAIDCTAPSGNKRILFTDWKSYINSTRYISDIDGTLMRLDIPEDAHSSFAADHLLVRPRTPWTIAGETYVPDTVLAFSLSKVLAGIHEPTVLFEPNALTSIEAARLVAGCAVISILDDLRPVTRIFTPPVLDTQPGSPWVTTTIPGLPEAGVISVYPLDAEESESDGTLLVRSNNPITPSALSLSSTSCSTPVLLRQAPATFDVTGLAVTRFDATAEDGERIPYIITGPIGEFNGDAPVYMTGYGGFGASSLPHYDSTLGLLWLAQGGFTVTAHIRGGGEYGTRWHEAGRGPLKHVSHDDFAAVAADLVRRGITRPERIAAEGGSNGGLMMANMWTRHPDRFGALFCTLPLTDMRRYTQLLTGRTWIDEYGDPETVAGWNHLQHISPYHNAVSPTGRAPAILVATTQRDDRVHPGHARKLAAKLREIGANVLFYEAAAGGHGFGADNEQYATFKSLGMLFLRRNIGWEAEHLT